MMLHYGEPGTCSRSPKVPRERSQMSKTSKIHKITNTLFFGQIFYQWSMFENTKKPNSNKFASSRNQASVVSTVYHHLYHCDMGRVRLPYIYIA